MERDPKAEAEKLKKAEEDALKFKGEESFIDDYERPVLEKYEKVSPTPLTRPKKEKGETKVSIIMKQYVDITFIFMFIFFKHYTKHTNTPQKRNPNC